MRTKAHNCETRQVEKVSIISCVHASWMSVSKASMTMQYLVATRLLYVDNACGVFLLQVVNEASA